LKVGRWERFWKFEISDRRQSSDDGDMALGSDLWREKCPAWEDGGSFLLLNPRLPEAWRHRVMVAEFPALADHVWLATSGTGGVLKLVALSRDALEASARAVNAHLGVSSSDVWVNPLPLFHVGGLGIMVRSALSGSTWRPATAWNGEVFVAELMASGATLTSLVPTQVYDLVRGRLRAPAGLRAAIVGGGALDERLHAQAVQLGWPLCPSYGLTEFGSQLATARAGAEQWPWLPLLAHAEARVDGAAGVLELRGPSLLTGWMIFDEGGAVRWEDPKVEGWLRTGDRGELRGRELRVLGRVDDLVKVRGELVDIAALERALEARVAGGGVAVRSVVDARNGVVLSVVAETAAAAEAVRRVQDEVFPPFARPQEILVGEIARTELGKLRR
jgi:O-succinylbenzoic acid--CoA ligase